MYCSNAVGDGCENHENAVSNSSDILLFEQLPVILIDLLVPGSNLLNLHFHSIRNINDKLKIWITFRWYRQTPEDYGDMVLFCAELIIAAHVFNLLLLEVIDV